MGAQDFYFVRYGLDVKAEYADIVEEEIREYGHSSGFSHKGGLTRVNLPANVKTPVKIQAYIEKLMDKDEYADKWAPTFYICVPKSRKKEINEICGVITTKPNIKVAAQWETIHVVHFFDGIRDRRIEKKTAKEANEVAKNTALKGIHAHVTLEKKLVSKDSLIVSYHPKYKKVNKLVDTYYFFGFKPS